MAQYEKQMIKYHCDKDTNEEIIENPTLAPGQKTIVMVVHDECCFSAHDGRKYLWIEGDKGHNRKKGQGKSIMVSEFLCECHGHMKITPDQATQFNYTGADLVARVIIHPGANDDGYWKNEDVAKQLRDTNIPIFNIIHPPETFQGLFCFDHSSNHKSYAPDALITTHLNVSDGGVRLETGDIF